LSVWPFAARTQRLYLLVDPSLPDTALRAGLLRAMQQAYFRSDSCSQTRAVRDAAMAAHYVLQHRNRGVLLQNQLSAATAVAAVRGTQAYVALAGAAAVFAWRRGDLSGQRGLVRLARPLGLEQEPRITLWSTPLDPADRLVLTCGMAWGPDSSAAAEGVLRSAPSNQIAEEQLAELLGGTRRAGVLIVDPARGARPERHLVLVSSVEHGREPAPRNSERGGGEGAARQRGGGRARLRWLPSLVALALLGVATIAALNPSNEPPRLSLAHQSEALLQQAGETTDPVEAHALAAQALDLAQQASSGQPDDRGDLVDRAAQILSQVDRVEPVSPAMAVRLGPSGRDVIDLAIGDASLFTLDVVEGAVRVFGLDARDQQPTPDTILVKAGAAVTGDEHPLASPVAIQYLSGDQPGAGALTIVDQARTVVQVGRDRSISARPLSSTSSWRELGALGGAPGGDLLVLDSGSRRLLSYAPPTGERGAEAPPRVILDGGAIPGLAFERAAEVVGQGDDVFLRMDDGTVHRFDAQAGDHVVSVRPPDGGSPRISGIASDRAGGLYLADPANARVLHVTTDGAVLRQLRDPALGGVRQIQSSLDGRRLYGLVTSGVLVFDVPDLAPR
jgi:hypothetical protein